VFLEFLCCRAQEVSTQLFGNPAIPLIRTRGFASPDFSGFAFSEIFYSQPAELTTARNVPAADKNPSMFFSGGKYDQFRNFLHRFQQLLKYSNSDASCQKIQSFPFGFYTVTLNVIIFGYFHVSFAQDLVAGGVGRAKPLKRKCGLASDLPNSLLAFTARPAISAHVPILQPGNFADENPFLRQANENFLLQGAGYFTRLPETFSRKGANIGACRLASSDPEMASEPGTARKMDGLFRRQAVWNQAKPISPTSK
jgi:hypothetical protein